MASETLEDIAVRLRTAKALAKGAYEERRLAEEALVEATTRFREKAQIVADLKELLYDAALHGIR